MSDGRLFNRRVRLTVGQEPPTDNFVQIVPDAIVIEDLRVTFKVEKSIKKEPCKAEIAVYNLNEQHRGQLAGKGLRVVLEAGYQDTMTQIYLGHSRTIDHPKESVNWVTKIACGTNERQLQFASVSSSFKPGSLVGKAVQKIAGSLVNDLGNTNEKAGEIEDSFASGYSAFGNSADELTRLLNPRGYGWSIQDGRMEILKFDETLPDEVVDLSPSTGLIGTPELGAPLTKGKPSPLKFRSLLQGRVRVGGLINLNSSNRSGIFKVTLVRHVGDTDGGDWMTEIEAFPVQL